MIRQFLPFAQPDLDGTEAAQILEVLQSGWLSTGPKTKKFEQEFATYLGARHAIAVNSCTAAMHLALEAVGVEGGDEIITTPYTFAATAEVIRYFDATPIFVDVDADTLNIDPEAVEAAITPRTKAIIPVHIAGQAAPLKELWELAARYDLAVVEDAAHALPTWYDGRLIGSDLPANVAGPPGGRLACFSFYATKTLTTAEGGMICTDNDEWAERVRIMSLHGISRDAWKRYTSEGTWHYDIMAPGYKYNMNDLCGALGLAQLQKVERMWQRRREIAHLYTEAFSSMPCLQAPAVRRGSEHAWHLYMLRLDLDALLVDRAAFIEELKLRDVGASVHFIPLHVHPYYRDTYGYRPEDFPVAFGEYMREVSLPIYSKMTDAEVEHVIYSVGQIVAMTRKRSPWRLRQPAHRLQLPFT